MTTVRASGHVEATAEAIRMTGFEPAFIHIPCPTVSIVLCGGLFLFWYTLYMTKKLILLFLFIGSIIGSYIPLLWGGSAFSGSAVLFSTLGGFLGIYIGYKIGSQLE